MFVTSTVERFKARLRRQGSKPRLKGSLSYSHVNLSRTGSIWSLSNQMTEGRRSQIVLLDERRLDILIQPKLYAGELLDMVASHFNLKEKEYFGLAFIDDTGHYNWLQLDKRVLEHEFPKKSSQGPLVLYFLVKYFVESITHLKDSATVEAFYLQATSLVFKGAVEVDSDTAFKLAAHVLQATHGDYVDDATTKAHLKKLPGLPTSALKEHPSLSVCEERITEHYKKQTGQSRGTAIVSYMTIIESLPTYGVHYYEVKDKAGIPWWLGLSFKGLSQYDYSDRRTPRRVFLWKQLENLYFRDRKFSIEVHDPKRVVHTLSSFNLYEDAIEEPVEEVDDLSDAICDPSTQVSVSRRTFGPGNVTVYVWFAATAALTKCIWSMAIAQHQFYLDRKHAKSRHHISRNLGEIAADLSRSVQSLSSAGSVSNLSRSASSLSLPALKIDDGQSDRSSAKIEMLAALKARKDALEAALRKKTEELKALCVREGELTGELPPETPLVPGEPLPQVRRRVGTAFTLNDKLILKAKSKEEEALAKMELEFEIQSQITSAALKLASDLSARKTVRRHRKQTYQQAYNKLKELEHKLISMRRQVEAQKQKLERNSVGEDPCEDSISHSTEESDPVFADPGVNLSDLSMTLSPQGVKLEEKNNHLNAVLNGPSKSPSPAPSSSSSIHPPSDGQGPHGVLASSSSAPPSPTKLRHMQLPPSYSTPVTEQHRPLSRTGSMGQESEVSTMVSNVVRSRPGIYGSQQYTPSSRPYSTYSAGSDYDNNSAGSAQSLKFHYRNRFESTLNLEGSNLYSVPTQRTSQAFDSQDDLLASPPPEPQNLGLMSRHNSLENTRRRAQNQSPHPNHHHLHLHHNHQSMIAASVSSFSKHSMSSSTSFDDHYQSAQSSPAKTTTSSSSAFFSQQSSVPHTPHVVHTCHHTSQQKPDSRSLDSLDCVQQDYPSSFSVPRETLDHSYSEDALDGMDPPQPTLRHHLDHLHISEPDLNLLQPGRQQFPESQSMHHGFQEPSGVISIGGKRETNIYDAAMMSRSPQSIANSGPSLNYSALDVSPKSADSQHSIYVSSDSMCGSTPNSTLSKNKPKEWLETSLDSPLLQRKSKTYPEALAECPSPLQSVHSSSMHMMDHPCGDTPLHFIEQQHQHPPPPCMASPHQRIASPLQQHLHGTPEIRASPQLHCSQDHHAFAIPPSPISLPGGVEVNVVTVGHFQPYWEETKPYELSDFYKYSAKHRKQQQQQQQQQQSQQHSCEHTTLESSNASCGIFHSSSSHEGWNGGEQHQMDPRMYNKQAMGDSPANCLPHSAATASTPHMVPSSQSALDLDTSSCVHFDHRAHPTFAYSQRTPDISRTASPMVMGVSPRRRMPSGDSRCDIHSHVVRSADNSFNLDHSGPRASVADAFHEEMIAWYEDQDNVKSATLV